MKEPERRGKKKQVVVAGLGRFGISVATTLYQLGHEVLALDADEKAVQSLVGKVTYAVQTDVTDEESLRQLGVSNFDTAVVGIGSDIQNSVMTTVLLKSLGLKDIICRAQNETHGNALQKVGATRVIFPEKEIGQQVAHSIFNPDVIDYMEILPNYGISKILPPFRLLGHTLDEAELGPGSKHGVRVILIKRGREVLLNPAPSEKIREDDILILAGRDEDLVKFRA